MSDVRGFSNAFVGSTACYQGERALSDGLATFTQAVEKNALRVLDDERATVRFSLATDTSPTGKPHDANTPISHAVSRLHVAPSNVRSLANHVQGPSNHPLEEFPLVYEGCLLGVLMIWAPPDILRSKHESVRTLVEMSASLLGSAATAANDDRALRRIEELISLAASTAAPPAELLMSVMRLSSEVMQAPLAAWIRTPVSPEPMFLDACGLPTTAHVRTLRRRIKTLPGHELDPRESGRATAARVASLLGSKARVIVCRKEALLVLCGTPQTLEREVRIISDLLNIVLARTVASTTAEEKSHRLDIALGTATHELKRPLAATRGLLDLLLARNTASLDDWSGLLRRSRDELSHLLSICDTFLRWGMAINPHPGTRADVGKVLREVVAEAQLVGASQEIRIDCPHQLGALADEQLLRVAIANLVHNALDHSPESRGVDVAARRWDDHISIEVTDQGIGIPPEERESIFEPFVRSKASRAHGASGAGLGLFIARRLIEAHRGTIQVDVTQRGTTFRALVPALPKASRQDAQMAVTVGRDLG